MRVPVMPTRPVMRWRRAAHAVDATERRANRQIDVELHADAVRPITIPTLLPLPKLALDVEMDLAGLSTLAITAPPGMPRVIGKPGHAGGDRMPYDREPW